MFHVVPMQSGAEAHHAPAGKKRRPQVKLACLNCRKQHAGCTESRPCDRCIRLNLTATCEDVPRKKRSKRKAMAEQDEDDLSHSINTLDSPPTAKRPKRGLQATPSRTKSDSLAPIDDIDPHSALLLPPGTTVPSNALLGMASTSQSSYSLPPVTGHFDSPYFDSMALSRGSIPYQPIPSAYSDQSYNHAGLYSGGFYPGYGYPAALSYPNPSPNHASLSSQHHGIHSASSIPGFHLPGSNHLPSSSASVYPPLPHTASQYEHSNIKTDSVTSTSASMQSYGSTVRASPAPSATPRNYPFPYNPMYPHGSQSPWIGGHSVTPSSSNQIIPPPSGSGGSSSPLSMSTIPSASSSASSSMISNSSLNLPTHIHSQMPPPPTHASILKKDIK